MRPNAKFYIQAPKVKHEYKMKEIGLTIHVKKKKKSVFKLITVS